MNLTDKVVLITGGTGSFGQAFTKKLLTLNPKKIIIYSRDEHKQEQMEREFSDNRLRFFLGDVRDLQRLKQAFTGVDIVVHAAAYKIVPKAEYCPEECVKTNIDGARNVINAVLESNVQRAMLVSTDKAVQPINLYGSTKMVAEKLFVQANLLNESKEFVICRYGNVAGSRGSIVPLFFEKRNTFIPITNLNATRFWFNLDQAINHALLTLERAGRGEIYVPRIPSVRVKDVAEAIAPGTIIKIIGDREGDKLHESLIGPGEIRRTHGAMKVPLFIIYPPFVEPLLPNVHQTKDTYSSDNNEFLSIKGIQESIKDWFVKEERTA